MPQFTVTYVDIVQRTYDDVEDEQAAIERFRAEEVTDSMDLYNGLRVKDGPSFGEQWIDFAADLDASKSYDSDVCNHPGCGRYLQNGCCEHEDEQIGAHFDPNEKVNP